MMAPERRWNCWNGQVGEGGDDGGDLGLIFGRHGFPDLLLDVQSGDCQQDDEPALRAQVE